MAKGGRCTLPTWAWMPHQRLMWVAHSLLCNDISNPAYRNTRHSSAQYANSVNTSSHLCFSDTVNIKLTQNKTGMHWHCKHSCSAHHNCANTITNCDEMDRKMVQIAQHTKTFNQSYWPHFCSHTSIFLAILRWLPKDTALPFHYLTNLFHRNF